MNLTAVTANGVRSILDNFSVQSAVDFDVARNGATRIYPAANYTMNITYTDKYNNTWLSNNFYTMVSSTIPSTDINFP